MRSQNPYRSWHGYLSLLMIIALGRVVYWIEPFGISVDESTYLAIAEAWNHYGKLYVDSVDRKPPLFYALYNWIGAVGGFWNIHFVHFVFILITFSLCLIAERIARLLKPAPKPGQAAILFAVVSSCFPREFISANSEIASLIPLGISLWILVSFAAREKLGHQRLFLSVFLAASLAAIATLYKQVAALPYAFAVIGWCLWLITRKRFSRVITISLATFFGVGLVYAATALSFFLAGTFNDFVRWNLTDNFSYVRDSDSVAKQSRPLFAPILAALAAWPFLWWGLIESLRSKDFSLKKAEWPVFLGALLGGFLVIYAGGRLYTHYFVPFSFVLSIASAGGVSLLLKSKARAYLISLIVISYFGFFAVTTFRDEIYSIVAPGKKSHSFDRETQMKLARVSEQIKSVSNADDRIVVWGMASQLYVMSERGSGTRFIPADYPSGRMAGFSSGDRHPYYKENMELYLKDIEAKKPKIFVDTASASLNDYQYFPIREYENLFAYLQKNYHLEIEIEGFGLWVRN